MRLRSLLLVVLVVLVAAGARIVPAPASAAEMATAGAGDGTSGLRLVGQTAWVNGSGVFHVQLRVDTPDPAGATIAGLVYSRLSTRTAFDQAVAGQVQGSTIFRYFSPAVASLPADGSGAVGIDIPVNQSTVKSFGAGSGSAVYPVVFQLHTRAGAPLGRSLTTFLVYSSGPTKGPGRLAVSLTVPVTAPAATSAPPARLAPGPSAALGALAGALDAHGDIPLTLAVDPGTLDCLAAGSAADRATLATLGHAASSDQVLAAPYYPVALSSLAAGGLSSEIAAQYQAGAAAIVAGLHRQPDTATAVLPGGLDAAGLAALQGTGVTGVVLPDSAMSGLPQTPRRITFASSTTLSAGRGPSVQAMAVDAGLSQMLTAGGDGVLSGQRILAGLALVQLEAPFQSRAVALVAPSGTVPATGVLATLLAGLRGNPFAQAVTAGGLFHTVPPAAPEIVRTLTATRSAPPLPDAATVRSARLAVGGLATIVPGQSRLAVSAQRQLLLATSSMLSADQRDRLLGQVLAVVRRAESGISLPGSSSVTLTARTGTIPLTVLSNPSLSARVQLRVTSPKLTFRPFATPAGSCAVTDSSTETCMLTLTSEATTLRIPVESRTSGVFSLQVVLASPDGGVVLATNRDTVRSTAFSQVGLILIVAAALGLVTWWIRNARHGRRARQLVAPGTDLGPEGTLLPEPSEAPSATAPTQVSDPEAPVPPPAPPVETTFGADMGAEPADGPAVPRPAPGAHRFGVPPFPEAGGALGGPVGEPPWVDDDPAIAEFFASPAPEYGDRRHDGDHVSPSSRRQGPNSEVDDPSAIHHRL